MQPDEAWELVGYLKANWEREKISEERLKLVAAMLGDMDYQQGYEAVQHLIATEEYFPVVATIRRCVAERLLGLPDSAAAWELADAWARNVPPQQPCPSCAVGAVPTPGFKDFQADVLCPDCNGKGTRPDPDHTVVLPAPVRRAAELVGGKRGIIEADPVPVVRSQFTKAYLQFREEAVRGVQVPATLQLAAAARREALTQSEAKALPAPALRDL